MAKIRKSFIALLVVVCLAAGFALSACGDKADNSVVTYTLTVVTQDNQPVEGVKVTLNQGGASFGPETTDSNGKVSFDAPAADYVFAISGLSNLYSLPSDVNLSVSAKSPNLTVKLEKAFAYKVNLVNPDNTPFTVAGATVGICVIGENCLPPVAAVNGVAEVVADKGDYGIIIDLPDGYTYEMDSHGYYAGEYFTEDKTEITVPVYPAADILSGKRMTEDEITDFTLAADGKTVMVFGVDKSKESYYTTAQVKPNENYFIEITPDFSGKYLLYSNDSLSYYYNGGGFTNEGLSSFLPQYAFLNAGTTYYIRGYNPSDKDTATAQFVVQVPESSYYLYTGNGGTFELTVGSKESSAIVSYAPTTSGAFKVSVNNDVKAIVKIGDGLADSIDEDTDEDAFTAGDSVVETILQGYTGYFNFNVWADEYPATFEVTLERIASADEVYKTATVKEALKQTAEAEEDKGLAYVDMNSSTNLVLGNDGYYHLGDGGDIVYVNITGTIPANRFSEGTFAYIDMNSYIQIKYDFTSTATTAKGDEYTVTESYKNYLRGFVDYVYKAAGQQSVTASVPESINNNSYAYYVNSDGVYPLTEELKDFLELFFRENKDVIKSFLPEIDNYDTYGWMFPLCHYVDASELEDGDEIVGTYGFVYASSEWGDEEIKLGDFVNRAEITADYCTLTVYNDGTFAVVSTSNNGLNFTGTWSNDDGAYTFTFKDGAVDWDFNAYDADYTATFNAGTGEIELSTENGDAEYPVLKFKDKEVDEIVGTYGFVYASSDYGYDEINLGDVVNRTEITADYCTLTVYNDGTFKVVSMSNYGLNFTGTWSNDDGAYTFTFKDGALDLSYNPYDADYTATFNAVTGGIELSTENEDAEYPVLRFNKI